MPDKRFVTIQSEDGDIQPEKKYRHSFIENICNEIDRELGVKITIFDREIRKFREYINFEPFNSKDINKQAKIIMSWQVNKIKDYYSNKNKFLIDSKQDLAQQYNIRKTLINNNLLQYKIKPLSKIASRSEADTNKNSGSDQQVLGASEIDSVCTSQDENWSKAQSSSIKMVQRKSLANNGRPLLRNRQSKINYNIKDTNQYKRRVNVNSLFDKQTKLLEEIEDMVKEMPFFIKFDKETRLLLLENAELQQYARGDVVVKQGEVGDGMYVILYGSCNVLVKIPHPASKELFNYVRFIKNYLCFLKNTSLLPLLEMAMHLANYL